MFSWGVIFSFSFSFSFLGLKGVKMAQSVALFGRNMGFLFLFYFVDLVTFLWVFLMFEGLL